MAVQQLFMGGIGNYADPIMNIPLYAYSWIFIVILCVLSWMGWKFGPWKTMTPLHGMYYAFKNSSKAVFIFNSHLTAELLAEKDAALIFDYSKWEYEGLTRFQKIFFNYSTVFLDNISTIQGFIEKIGKRNHDVEIAAKLQGYEINHESSVVSGGIHLDLILDSGNWSVKTSPEHQAIEAAAMAWNEVSPDNQIHSYSKFQRLINEGKIPVPAGVKAHVTIPWVRIDQSLPIQIEDNVLAGARRQTAEDMMAELDNELKKYYLPILLGGFGFAALIFIGRVIVLKM